jgi:predicted DCC family thiol-disulfide oxidoreductase YuxK
MTQPVLLYDGDCGLCNRVVRLLLRSDRAARLKFAPLQSAPAQAYLRRQGLPTADFDSLVFVPDWNTQAAGAYLRRTDGALAAAAEVGGVWGLVTWARVLPAGLRDPFYQLVARSRYALFGQYFPAPLKPEWEARFLALGKQKGRTQGPA